MSLFDKPVDNGQIEEWRNLLLDVCDAGILHKEMTSDPLTQDQLNYMKTRILQ